MFLSTVELPIGAWNVVELLVWGTTVVPFNSMTSNGIVVVPEVSGVVE
jgi:hypothetical protein